jgi:hypothetical protein
LAHGGEVEEGEEGSDVEKIVAGSVYREVTDRGATREEAKELHGRRW